MGISITAVRKPLRTAGGMVQRVLGIALISGSLPLARTLSADSSQFCGAHRLHSFS
jgi:hypothetical protein